MSQTLSDRLSIDQIARLWAAENENAAFGADDIAGRLVGAAESGEFEHPTYSREDAPPWKLTHEESQEEGTVETKETTQPGVGPYLSTLTMQDGRPVNAVDIQNYIKARQTAPGATDRETRRVVAREIFLSVEGLRRWCDEPGFGEWAKLRGLSRPRFIEPQDDGSAPASDPGPSATCKPQRHHDPLEDAALKNRIEMVLATARTEWPDESKRPGIRPMAKHLANAHRKKLGFNFETIRHILRGTYTASKRLDIRGL